MPCTTSQSSGRYARFWPISFITSFFFGRCARSSVLSGFFFGLQHFSGWRIRLPGAQKHPGAPGSTEKTFPGAEKGLGALGSKEKTTRGREGSRRLQRRLSSHPAFHPDFPFTAASRKRKVATRGRESPQRPSQQRKIVTRGRNGFWCPWQHRKDVTRGGEGSWRPWQQRKPVAGGKEAFWRPWEHGKDVTRGGEGVLGPWWCQKMIVRGGGKQETWP